MITKIKSKNVCKYCKRDFIWADDKCFHEMRCSNNKKGGSKNGRKNN